MRLMLMDPEECLAQAQGFEERARTQTSRQKRAELLELSSAWRAMAGLPPAAPAPAVSPWSRLVATGRRMLGGS
jgi:hypothetical protein